MCKLNFFDKLSVFLVLISALNWGSIGLFNINFLFTFLGDSTIILRCIYILILICALDLISLPFRCNIFKSLNDI